MDSSTNGLYGWLAGTMSDELTEFENRLFEWIRQSDFEKVAWSSKKAAKAFEVDENDVYEALSALTRKVPKRIQLYYSDGNIHIAAE